MDKDKGRRHQGSGFPPIPLAEQCRNKQIPNLLTLPQGGQEGFCWGGPAEFRVRSGSASPALSLPTVTSVCHPWHGQQPLLCSLPPAAAINQFSDTLLYFCTNPLALQPTLQPRRSPAKHRSFISTFNVFLWPNFPVHTWSSSSQPPSQRVPRQLWC